LIKARTTWLKQLPGRERHLCSPFFSDLEKITPDNSLLMITRGMLYLPVTGPDSERIRSPIFSRDLNYLAISLPGRISF